MSNQASPDSPQPSLSRISRIAKLSTKDALYASSHTEPEAVRELSHEGFQGAIHYSLWEHRNPLATTTSTLVSIS